MTTTSPPPLRSDRSFGTTLVIVLALIAAGLWLAGRRGTAIWATPGSLSRQF